MYASILNAVTSCIFASWLFSPIFYIHWNVYMSTANISIFDYSSFLFLSIYKWLHSLMALQTYMFDLTIAGSFEQLLKRFYSCLIGCTMVWFFFLLSFDKVRIGINHIWWNTSEIEMIFVFCLGLSVQQRIHAKNSTSFFLFFFHYAVFRQLLKIYTKKNKNSRKTVDDCNRIRCFLVIRVCWRICGSLVGFCFVVVVVVVVDVANVFYCIY